MAMNRDTILRIIILIHFLFVSMVLLAEWLPKAYLLNQVTILALGLWAIIHRESLIEVELLMLVQFISIIIDSIAIGMYFQIGKHTYAMRYDNKYFILSAVFAILLLILKPIMLLLLNKVRQDRLDNSGSGAWATASGYTSVLGR